jgi:hypothetical protein
MTNEKKTKDVTVWLTESMELELRRLAELDSRKLSDYISLVLRRHIWGNAVSSAPKEEGADRGG